jgi:hypothetical protein
LKKALTIGLVAAALAATLPFAFAGSKAAAPSADTRPEYRIAASVRMADASVVVPAYTRGPRIIHVPQATERNERLNSRASVTHDPAADDDDDIAPPRRRTIEPPVRATPRWTPHREVAPSPPRRSEPAPKSRTEPRAVRHIDMSKPKTAPKAELKPEPPVPQPPSPRRALLSAPPLPAEGPSPVRPTPRFGAKAEGTKAEAGEKFAAPRFPEITADTPPPGYSPPAAPPRDDGYGNKY